VNKKCACELSDTWQNERALGSHLNLSHERIINEHFKHYFGSDVLFNDTMAGTWQNILTRLVMVLVNISGYDCHVWIDLCICNTITSQLKSMIIFTFTAKFITHRTRCLTSRKTAFNLSFCCLIVDSMSGASLRLELFSPSGGCSLGWSALSDLMWVATSAIPTKINSTIFAYRAFQFCRKY